jgi:hypothetical protein
VRKVSALAEIVADADIRRDGGVLPGAKKRGSMELAAHSGHGGFIRMAEK